MRCFPEESPRVTSFTAEEEASSLITDKDLTKCPNPSEAETRTIKATGLGDMLSRIRGAERSKRERFESVHAPRKAAAYDLVYFILFAPIVTLGWMIYESHRKQMILLKVKSKQVKLEIEYEYALYIMMTLVRDCMQENVESQKVFG